MRDISKDLKTPSKTLVKTIRRTLHRNGLRKTPGQPGWRLFKLEVSPLIIWDDRWGDSLAAEILLMLGERSKRQTTRRTSSHSETQWWEHYDVGIIQCVWNWESHQGGSNHEERRMCEILKENLKQSAVKLFGSLFCLPTRQRPKYHTSLLEKNL